DRRFGAKLGGFADAFIGGWRLQAIGQIQSGQPISFHDRNIYFAGDLTALRTDYSGDTNSPVFDISGFYFHDAAVQTNGVDDPTNADFGKVTSQTNLPRDIQLAVKLIF